MVKDRRRLQTVTLDLITFLYHRILIILIITTFMLDLDFRLVSILESGQGRSDIQSFVEARSIDRLAFIEEN